MWLSSEFQARRAHDNPDSPSCAGQTHGQVLVAMPFSSESHGDGGYVVTCEVGQVPSATMESPRNTSRVMRALGIPKRQVPYDSRE
jgi:hypothetical protein